MNEAM